MSRSQLSPHGAEVAGALHLSLRMVQVFFGGMWGRTWQPVEVGTSPSTAGGIIKTPVSSGERR